MNTKHFLLSGDGSIQEFTAEEAARVANGLSSLPQFAERSARYVQVTFDGPSENNEIQVRTSGACLHFDHDGKLAEADDSESCEKLSRFEHDTCIQLALREADYMHDTIH